MIIKYKQYISLDDYEDVEIEVPDDCSIYKINWEDTTEEDVTSVYIIISNSKFNDSIFFGKFYLYFLSNAIITNAETEIKTSSELPNINDIYIVHFMDGCRGDLSKITGIGKLDKFTSTGISIKDVGFKSFITGKPITKMEIIERRYNLSLYFCYFTTSAEIAKRYLQEVNNIYKNFLL